MDRLLGISEGSGAAIHALALAAAEGGRITAAGAAERLGLSPSYLAKLLQVLSRRGVLSSARGAAGGYRLEKDASELSCLEIVEALEGPLPVRECLFEAPVCARRTCRLGTVCRDLSRALRQTLEAASVADIAEAFSKPGPEARRGGR
jgi:Rrf2 family protein